MKKLQQRKTKIQQIKKKAAKKVLENAQLEKDIADMQSALQESRKSWKATGNKPLSALLKGLEECEVDCVWLWPVGSLVSQVDNEAAEREMRYQKILQVKNLKSQAKSQERELASLQEEVQSLRRRNFPLLARLKNKWGQQSLYQCTVLLTLLSKQRISPHKIISMQFTAWTPNE